MGAAVKILQFSEYLRHLETLKTKLEILRQRSSNVEALDARYKKFFADRAEQFEHLDIMDPVRTEITIKITREFIESEYTV